MGFLLYALGPFLKFFVTMMIQLKVSKTGNVLVSQEKTRILLK